MCALVSSLIFGLFQVTLRGPMMDSVWCVLDPYYSIRTLIATLFFPTGEDVKGED